MTAPIVCDGLVKRYGRKLALDGLSLEVPAGAVYALLGENGAGKSTTIRVLTGQHPPDAGRASVLGRDAWADAVALRRRFQLDSTARLRELSKGGYAKVGLALALAPDPEVLILDEPTSGLDLLVRREFLSSMIDLAGTGRTILISSHQIAELERVASHAAFLSHGKLLLAGSMDELRQRLVRLRLRYEGSPPDPAHLGRVLKRNGTGRLWQAVLRDPDRAAIERLRNEPGVRDVEELPLSLEEAYAALLAGQPAGGR
jgi:ABC-2 type transport system ATP-binding protein